MKSHQISAFCLLMTVLLSSTLANNGYGLLECCFTYFPQRLRMDLITGYKETSANCPYPGIIFYTKNGQELCVNPSNRWVQNVKQKLDQQLYTKNGKKLCVDPSDRWVQQVKEKLDQQ